MAVAVVGSVGLYPIDRSTGELSRDGVEQRAVASVQPTGIDLEHLQGGRGDLGVDRAAVLYLSEVAHPLEKSVRHAWGSARAGRDRLCSIGVDLDAKDAGGAQDNLP